MLPFTFGASLTFPVISGLTYGEASATPNPFGSGYNILIKRLDGQQVCNLWINNYSTCRGSATIGQTYRAVVENSTGHVAGQTSWWTLTADGPEQETADDLDLIALAALYAAPSAVCTHVLLYPGTHVAGSSVSDQYLACEAAVQQGANTLGVLRAIVAAGGGTAVLWFLHEQITEETRTHDPSDDETASGPTPSPPPIAWPVTLEDDADTLMTQNPGLTDPATARTVMKACKRAVRRAGLSPGDCLDLPVFVSGDLDVPQATDHDRESVSVRPQWTKLNYDATDKSSVRKWYEALPQCPDTRPPGQQCHEYPFFKTKQGGPGGSPTPRVKLVAAAHNMAQGSLFGHFARQCLDRVDNAAFLSIQAPKGSGIPTLRLCN